MAMALTPARISRYKDMDSVIGNTPLVKYPGQVQNGNAIWIKRECDNPFGSHYDRVYLALFREFEANRGLTAETPVMETSSGTAALSFVGVGEALGFRKLHVAIPQGLDSAISDLLSVPEGQELQKPEYLKGSVEHVIAAKKATVYFTPEQDYVNGFPYFIKRFLPRNKDIAFLNHSMDRQKGGPAYANNETSLSALEEITKEAMEHIPIGIYMPAVGNGSSVLGPARALGNETLVIPFESVQSAVLYGRLRPGRYAERFGITPGTLPRHKLRGTSYQGIDFPHIRSAVDQGIIDDVVLVSDRWLDAAYQERTGRRDTESLPHWDQQFPGCEGYGRSTRAGVAAALDVAKNHHGKNILVIAYDKAERYDKEPVIPN